MTAEPRTFIKNNLTSWLTSTRWYPLVELHTGDIIGPGHQDEESFACAARSFLNELNENPSDLSLTSKDIQWRWAIIEDGSLRLSEPDAPGAIPVTYLGRD